MKGDRRKPSLAATRQQTRDLFASMTDEELRDVALAHAGNSELEPGLHDAITAEIKAEVGRRKAAQMDDQP